MIRFNVPPLTGKEMDYMKQAVESMHICGDGDFTKKCSRWIEEQTGTGKCLLTTPMHWKWQPFFVILRKAMR